MPRPSEPFAEETAEGRWLVREPVIRLTSFNALRDTMVVAVSGLWMMFQG